MITSIQKNRRTQTSPSKKRHLGVPESRSKTDFSTLVEESIKPQSAAKTQELSERYRSINEMLEELHEYEKNLLQYPNDSNFHVYKKKIREIVSVIIKDAYELKVLRDRSRREFEVMKTMDQNLHQLFQNLMKQNPDLDAILKNLGDIRGILLDLQV